MGWSPGTPEFTSYYSTRIELRLEGIHFLTGFLIQGCTLTRRCTPEVTSLRVWNRTLTKYGVYDVGPDQLIVYRDDQSDFPVRDHLDNRHSVVHMFQKPSSANTILLTPWGHLLEQPDDPCFWGNSYPFCIQLEFMEKT